METTVGNIHKDEGRYCARPTIFGNPYTIGKDGTREEVIAKYRIYFNQNIVTNPVFKNAVLSLKGKKLLCFCHPLDCHCNVIADYLNEN